MEEHEDPDPAPAAPGKAAPAIENPAPVPENPPNPPRYGQHRPYPREQVHAILQAYAVWDGSTDEFCDKHKVYRGTLWAWRRQYRKEHGDYSSVTNIQDDNLDITDALCGTGAETGSNYVIAVVLYQGHTHFVVVTGEKINLTTNLCDFTIADPAKANDPYLSDYGETTNIRILTVY